MARITNAVASRKRRKRRLAQAKGFYGSRSKLFRVATEAVDRAMQLSYAHRKAKKRDFRGLSSSAFDGRGNYTLGLKEQLSFPEINYNEVVKSQGMDITIGTSAKTDREGYALLKAMGFPFND